MKKYLYTIFAVLLLSVSFSTPTMAYSITCEEKGDICYARCDKNWGGDTIVDGYLRGACKLGCSIAEFGCILKELND